MFARHGGHGGMVHRRIPNIDNEECCRCAMSHFSVTSKYLLAMPGQHLIRSLSLLYLISVKFELHANHHGQRLFVRHASNSTLRSFHYTVP